MTRPASLRLKSKQQPLFVAAPYQAAEHAIGTLAPGCRIFGLTKGQFSLIDILQAILVQTGPAHVVISTWTTGIRDADNAKLLLDTGKILSFRLLTDRSFATRQPKYVDAVLRAFGKDAIRCTNTHAKFLLVENDRWHLAVRSSMNLNRNPRFEQFDLDEDSTICDFLRAHVEKMEAEMPAGISPTFRQVDHAFTVALGGGLSDVYRLDSPEDDAPIDMAAFLTDEPIDLTVHMKD